MDADLYVPGDGWLHRADPRVKFLITVVMLVLCLVWRNWAFILDVLIIEHLMLITDGVPLKRIGWVWKILAVIIVFIVVLWPIFDPSGTHVLWQWGWLKLTRENLVTLATALRYIPVFFSIFQSVSAAQRARGLDLNGKKDATGKKRNVFVRLVDRFKSYLPIIIAVLIRAYKMSQSVGWAMESRGLNLQGVRRTYRIQLKMRLSDWIILAVTVAATTGSIWLMLWQF